MLQAEECQRRADECARLADATVNSILIARYRHLEASSRYLVRLKTRTEQLPARTRSLGGGGCSPLSRSAALRCFGVAGLVGRNRAKSLGKLFIAKRLRQRGVFLKARWKLARPIAGRENNRHAPTAKQVCDRIHYGPADIHIQDRGIEAGVGRKAKGAPPLAAGPTTSLPKSSTISSTSIAIIASSSTTRIRHLGLSVMRCLPSTVQGQG